jgi:LPXTG-motif cell wall-anchored protein
MRSARRRAAVTPRKVAGVAAGLLVLTAAQTGAAFAAPKTDGETKAGDIKIHNVGTGEDDNSNEPKVCTFTLVGDNFDAGESLSYAFALAPPYKDDPFLTGTAVADSLGSWSTAAITLPVGHWKVSVDDGEDTKFKVFKVVCDDDVTPADEPAGPPADDPAGPPADDPADPPADDPADPPADDPADPPADDPADPPVVTDPPAGTDGDPVSDPDPVTTDDTTDPAGDPDDVTDPTVEDPTTPDSTDPETTVPEADTPEADTPAAAPDADNAATGTEDSVVTGTWEERSSTLPATGAGNAAGLGLAGLLLVGAGIVLRRAVRA